MNPSLKAIRDDFDALKREAESIPVDVRKSRLSDIEKRLNCEANDFLQTLRASGGGRIANLFEEILATLK